MYLVRYLNDPLRKNSLLLLTSNVVTNIIGFVFWIVAARYYTANDLGIATSIVSACNLLVALSLLGVNISMVKFLAASNDKPGMINSSYTVVGLCSLTAAIVFLAGLNLWSPALLFLRGNWTYIVTVIILTIFTSLYWVQSYVFVAFRAAKYSLIQAILTGLRIPAVGMLAGLGQIGILLSFMACNFLAFLTSNFFLRRIIPGYIITPVIRKDAVRVIANFSAWNYISETLRILPGLVLPVIILNVLNAASSAYFFIAWMIATVLFEISFSVNASLLSECSRNTGDYRRQFTKAIKLILVTLIPGATVVILFGNFILSLFGTDYLDGNTYLLWILAISSIPLGFNEMYITMCRVMNKLGRLVIIRFIIALGTIIFGYFLTPKLGVVGIGIAWLILQLVFVIILMPLLYRGLLPRK